MFLKKNVFLYNKIFKEIIIDDIYRVNLAEGRFIRMCDHLEEYIMILIKDKIEEQYFKNDKFKEIRQGIIRFEKKGQVTIKLKDE